MPVRKIKKNYRSLTGFFASVKNGRSMAYESALERDYFLLLEFDADVLSYEEQPLTLDGALDGKTFKYTPDCLVHHRSGEKILAEVKYKSELEKDSELVRRLMAAKDSAGENGFSFRVVTDENIRGPMLTNVRFLYQYIAEPTNFVSARDRIVDLLDQAGEMMVAEMLDFQHSDELKRRALEATWHMVCRGVLRVDLHAPLSNNSVISLAP